MHFDLQYFQFTVGLSGWDPNRRRGASGLTCPPLFPKDFPCPILIALIVVTHLHTQLNIKTCVSVLAVLSPQHFLVPFSLYLSNIHSVVPSTETLPGSTSSLHLTSVIFHHVDLSRIYLLVFILCICMYTHEHIKMCMYVWV